MRPDVAFALPALAGGGVERVYLDLAGAMVKEGLRVDFVLASGVMLRTRWLTPTARRKSGL